MQEDKILYEEDEINLGELFHELKKNIKLIVISILLCTIIVGIITVFGIKKKYASTSRLFLKPEVTEGYADYSQINSNNLMVNNYIQMIEGNNIINQVSHQLNISSNEISSALTVSNETNTQIISITATTTDPKHSKEIVDAVVTTFKKEVKETLNVSNIVTVDEAQIASTPVSPSLKKNLLIGAMLGAVLSMGYVVILFLLDTRIHNKEEAEKYLGIPSLGSIPYFDK